MAVADINFKISFIISQFRFKYKTNLSKSIN